MTRKIFLIAGVAGLALTAPASAEKGDRNADRQKAERQQVQRAERPQRAERQQVQRAERPQRAERQQMQRAERPQRAERQQVQRAERPQRAERQQVQRAERPQRVERQRIERAERPQRIERQQQRVDRQAQRPQRLERQQQRAERPQRIERQQQRVERQAQRVERPQRFERQQQRAERPQRVERSDTFRPQRFERQQQRGDRRLAEQMFAPRRDNGSVGRTARFDGRGYRPGAPLFATRDMRQMTPFRAKFDDRQTFSIGDRVNGDRYLTSVPSFFTRSYVDTNDYYHRYDDDLGYVYRVDRNDGIVRGLMPLFGGYGIGDPWPQTYYSSYVPDGYRDYYYDTPDYYYRNDGYGIYQVDSSTQLINALVALVMGKGLGVGQMLPANYGAYNVPLEYRANYVDSDDSWYRYGDGFIYQVDPDSRRIAARYPIHADDYYVGDAWPVAYPDYNVPYGYRSAYYDTPQYHYRYADGGIYQVDPTNQVILALAALISGDQFAVGQQMPGGYDTYNVPFDYRDRYADSDRDWYRYANGNVYRVDAGSGMIEEAFPIYG